MNEYLERYAFKEQLIDALPSSNLGLVVVIPCCNEEYLIQSLESLHQADQPEQAVEVIVVLNASESAPKLIVKQNGVTNQEVQEWNLAKKPWYSLYVIQDNALPKKHAGVGLARKIGMDEAVRRFDQVGKDGVIVCFDADSLCESTYFVEIEQHFLSHLQTPSCSIHFEHPIEGTEFSSDIYEGIAQYELHLRYYKNGLAYAGLPYAFHTIGSSMAVRSSVYQKQNGMNKRKAGEDFYFLQKLIPLGGFTELKTTKVIPSPRVSDRVPFGTGRAIQEWLDEENTEMKTYHVASFDDLRKLNDQVKSFYFQKLDAIPESVLAYLKSIDFEAQLPKLIENSRSVEHFVELFYKWFNAFRVLKYMHFARDYYYPNQLISKSSQELLGRLNTFSSNDIKNLLKAYRTLDLA